MKLSSKFLYIYKLPAILILCVNFSFTKHYFGDIYKNDILERGLSKVRKCRSEMEKIIPENLIHLHHHHLTGDYFGATHCLCNMLLDKQRNKIVCFLHNLSRYDLFLLLAGVQDSRIKNLWTIPKSSEKLRCIAFNSYKIQDSIAHLPNSLSSLVDNLRISGHNFPILKKSALFHNPEGVFDEKLFNLGLQKGFFPFHEATSVEHLKSRKTFPSFEEFNDNDLDLSFTLEEYSHAFDVYSQFKCTSLLDYMGVYNLLDSLLLAEVMTSYDNTMKKLFGIHVWHFMTLPAYAFEANFLITKMKLPYIEKRSIYSTYDGNVKGGFSFTTRKIATENNFGKKPDDYKVFNINIDANS